MTITIHRMHRYPLAEIRAIGHKLQRVNEEISTIWSSITDKGVVLGYKEQIGIEDEIGSGIITNSSCVSNQICGAIATTLFSEHFPFDRDPIVKEADNIARAAFKEEHIAKSRKAFTDKLIQMQILSGMKMLDLGCGPDPGFARFCRLMGATVFTLDRYSFCFSGEEQRYHIETNLFDMGSVDVVLRASKGGFHFITSSQLFLEGSLQGQNYNAFDVIDEICHASMIFGGIFFNDDTRSPISYAKSLKIDCLKSIRSDAGFRLKRCGNNSVKLYEERPFCEEKAQLLTMNDIFEIDEYEHRGTMFCLLEIEGLNGIQFISINKTKI